MRYTLLLIAVAALPLAWGDLEAERAAPTSAGEAQFALDILYRQKTVQPRPIRVWPERFRREQIGKQSVGHVSERPSAISPG